MHYPPTPPQITDVRRPMQPRGSRAKNYSAPIKFNVRDRPRRVRNGARSQLWLMSTTVLGDLLVMSTITMIIYYLHNTTTTNRQPAKQYIITP